MNEGPGEEEQSGTWVEWISRVIQNEPFKLHFNLRLTDPLGCGSSSQIPSHNQCLAWVNSEWPLRKILAAFPSDSYIKLAGGSPSLHRTLKPREIMVVPLLRLWSCLAVLKLFFFFFKTMERVWPSFSLLSSWEFKVFCWMLSKQSFSGNLLLWSLRIHRRKKGGDEPGALEELTVKTWPCFVGWGSWGGVSGVWGTDVNLTWSSAAADRGLPEVNLCSHRGQKPAWCSPPEVYTGAGLSAGLSQIWF